ncbi:MAG: hypothetical protein K0R54_3592 [Clostridiaceae bacterium]|jgi:hypothetical protein|nr:hypothetical protein [Clostridiaceae bacterium]
MILYNKFQQEVDSLINMNLAITEYKVSIYDEMSKYLLEKKCANGSVLIDKAKNKMDRYVKNLKQDLIDIEDIFNQISIFIDNLFKDNQIIPKKFNIGNGEIYKIVTNENYTFMYYIGFDDFKNLHKYGVIDVSVNKRKINKLHSKIIFSEKIDLNMYIDFKIYFQELVNKFDKVNTVDKLNVINNKIQNKLLDFFNIYGDENLHLFLIKDSKKVEKIVGISGNEISKLLIETFRYTKIKIKLISKGYEIKSTDFLELIDLQLIIMNCQKELIKCIKNKEEEFKDIYEKSIESNSKEIETLKKKLNISTEKLNEIVNEIE